MAPTKKEKVSDSSEKAAAGNKTNKPKAPVNSGKRHGALSLLLSEGVRKSKEELEDDEDFEPAPATKKRKSAPKKKVAAETPKSLTWVSPVLSTSPKARARSPELTAAQRYVIDTAFVNRPNNRSVMSAQDYNLLIPGHSRLTEDQTKMLLDEGTVTPADLTLFSNSFNISEPEASADNVSAFSFPDDLDEVPKSAPAVMQSDAASDAIFSNFIDTSMLTGGPGPTIRATPSLDLSGQNVANVSYGTGLPTPVSAGGHQSDNSLESIAWSNSMSTLPGLEDPVLTLPPNITSSPPVPAPTQPDVVQEMRSIVGRFEEIINAAYAKVQNDRVTDALLATMETRIQDLETKNSKDQQNVYVQFNKCLTYLGQKISQLEEERARTHQTMQRLVQQIQAIQHRLAPRQGTCIPQVQVPQANMPGN